MVSVFFQISKPTERDGAYHLKFGFLISFSVDERLELGNRAIGKEISDVPFRTEKEEVVHNFRISGKFLFHLTFNRNFQIF